MVGALGVPGRVQWNLARTSLMKAVLSSLGSRGYPYSWLTCAITSFSPVASGVGRRVKGGGCEVKGVGCRV